MVRVLLVEDEAIAARAVSVMLERLGCEVAAVMNTGEKAIEAARVLRPDLVLMDIRLKGPMGGIEAASIIRERFGITSVFVTAYAEEELKGRSTSLTEFDCLTKPIDEEALGAVLRKVALS